MLPLNHALAFMCLNKKSNKIHSIFHPWCYSYQLAQSDERKLVHKRCRKTCTFDPLILTDHIKLLK